jgi:hypothetical protein
MRYHLAFGLGLGFLQVAGCGPGLSEQNKIPTARPVRAGTPPPSDEAGFRKLLVGEVVNGGLWFPDANCQTLFGKADYVKPEAFDAFARCVASLHLRPTGRSDSLDDTSILTDDAGFEIQAHVVAGQLDYIGFSARAPGAPDLPTITPQTLESLRAGGDPNATISAAEADRVFTPGNPSPTHTEHLRLCLAEDGQLATVMLGTTTTPAIAAAFSAVVRTWKFRPFSVANKPMQACAVVGFQYPATPRDENRDRLPRPPELSKAGHFVYNVSPVELSPLRIVGDNLVVPDDEDKIHLNGKRLVGSFKLCLDETGHYERGVLLKSTGVPGYDAKIAKTMMSWVYRPYVVDGVAIPVCSAVTFIYTQR